MTKTELIKQIYDAQRTMSRTRNMSPPDYSLSTLRGRLYKNKEFLRLFDNWVESGYLKKLKPSIDRINPLKTYKMDNIQIMTWGENERKGNKELCITRGRSVQILDDNGIVVATFRSIKEASLITKTSKTNIERSCNKGCRANGYTWKFIDSRRGHTKANP